MPPSPDTRDVRNRPPDFHGMERSPDLLLNFDNRNCGAPHSLTPRKTAQAAAIEGWIVRPDMLSYHFSQGWPLLPEAGRPMISVESVSKWFGDHQVLRDC